MPSSLPRPALAARIHALRTALDTLWTQVEADGAAPYACMGSCKVELLRLEEQARGHAVSDLARSLALAPLEVLLAAAGRRAAP
jgi:hypothetical protein